MAEYRAKHPTASLISLGIGDALDPILPCIAHALSEKALALGTREGFHGYGPPYGLQELREKIAQQFYTTISPEEITVSDGAKPEMGRLQLLFGPHLRVAVQDPAYPVYVDTSLMQGHSVYFYSAVEEIPPCDLIFYCSPNNPTGRAATHAELEKLVQCAVKNRAVILFDAAYSQYIQDPALPRSIYEIPGSHATAIEIHSFSKIAGFSGIRLGWTVVPKALGAIHNDWLRLIATAFNGASLISQAGALAALSHFDAVKQAIQKTMEKAKLLKKFLAHLPLTGGEHAPYLFAHLGMPSWDAFQHLLEEAQIISTPGSGFGPKGEGFLRFTAFAKQEEIEACQERLKFLIHRT